MDAESVRKTLKIYNLTIKNAILIKLTTIMYLYEKIRASLIGRKRRRNWKTSKNELENQIFGLIS